MELILEIQIWSYSSGFREAHNLKKIQDNYRIGGDFEADRALDPDIEKLKTLTICPNNNPPSQTLF